MKKYIVAVFIFFCLININELKAQPEFEDGVEDTPIDSFSAILTIGALILGVKNHQNFFSSDKFSKKSR